MLIKHSSSSIINWTISYSKIQGNQLKKNTLLFKSATDWFMYKRLVTK